ncbi:Na+/H+ antiporter NhaA [Serinibacter arcticus]|uniref:Na(+)/H(+) antiporter NhaA n=1 Tax=Serinibacter arcticus TaxID=1655435 RepID=A0A2U1ZYS6_9MICO|nr:Na+/H+ antiporter NhaA [Serinibacter arcticus]PWD52137.1 Na+/H+ antiporter NhaA [Serinibacter arcticus]
MSTTPSPLFSSLTPGGRRNLLDTLRAERTGGVLLLLGAVVGLVLANGPTRAWFEELTHAPLTVGPIELSVAHWAADGLLAIFFFVVGLELTREIQVGELRHVRTAVVPMVGAVGGMLAPAAIYLAVNASAPGGDVSGWAVPTATDIAFAVAVLALVAPGLPVAVRAFLLTLAVVDDLLAIVIIAVAYSDGVAFGWLALSLVAVVAFALVLRSPLMRSRATTVLLVAVAVLAWVAMLRAGVHATIAGVALGLVVPARGATADGRAAGSAGEGGDDGRGSLAERFEHAWRPVSAGFAVPVFALFTAGVVVEPDLLAATFADPVAWGVLLGLVVGKPLGITAATWLLCRFTGARLASGVRWRDISAVSCLAGIGFTVSLLIGSLAFGGSDRSSEVVIAVLTASVVAAVVGAVALRLVRPRESVLPASVDRPTD